MIQATVEVSVPLEDWIVNDVPAVRVDTRSQPGVPPSELPVSWIRLFAATAVVDGLLSRQREAEE